MELKTRNFGTVHVDEDAIYKFPDGLYGFEDCKEFGIFQHDYDENLSLLYMQNTEDLFPSFLVFEPWDMYEGYDPHMDPADLKLCGADSEDDLIFLSIATLPSSLEMLSLNIKSPVVLNPKTKEARQVILTNPEYEVRYYPFQTPGRKEGK
ncbi:MAG: flagellar assembly protein FliW [Firmicutes bacterium]|nr:flagellar assembly protein FliW [Bacillota bacterium]